MNLDTFVINTLNKDSDYILLKNKDSIDNEIISNIMADIKSRENKLKETTEFILIDNGVDGLGISMSIFNRPIMRDGNKNQVEGLVSLANETNKKFKVVNVSYINKPSIGFIFVITASTITYKSLCDEYDSLLFANDEIDDKENEEENNQIKQEKELKEKIESIIRTALVDMKLAILDASLYIDDKLFFTHNESL